MELLVGLCIIIFGLFMLFILSLFSQAFPKEVLVGNEEVLKDFFTMNNLIYPIIVILVGLCLSVFYCIKTNKA